VGLSYGTIRAVGSALLVAAAVGTGGMTGMASALAVDSSTVAVRGTLADGTGHALGGVHLTIVEELPPDGGLAAFSVTTAGDGSFRADLYAWGSADAPASVTVKTDPAEELTVEDGSCSRTWSVEVSDVRQLALADSAPEPLAVMARTALLGEVCGTTGTPGGGTSSGNGGNSGGAGGPMLTPPPTDVRLSPATPTPERLAPSRTLGFVLGLVLATALLLPRPASRGRG
jgi:hypothetical protein